MDREKVLFALLRAVICGKPLTIEVKAACTQEMLFSVGSLSKHHDLVHLVAKAAGMLGLPESEVLTKCKQAEKRAIFRYMRLSCEYERICKTLEETAVPFIPLKGSILRDYYPEPWMRTSSDIDILVKEEQLELAANALKKELKYVEEEKSDHDISLYSPTGVHLELHYDTVPECYKLVDSSNVLSRIWEDAKPTQPGTCFYSMSDAMFYFYHIAHMAKHLENGGCGIRTFLDLWILNHRVEHDDAQRKRLLAEGGLLTFGETAEKLSEVWFSEAVPDALTDEMERFVLDGGVYGSMKNNVAIKQKIKGGKLRYALSRIYISYDKIKLHYPILQKHRWLLPVYQVVRWCKLLFKGGVKRSIYELKVNAAMSREEGQSAMELLVKLGLK